MLIERTTAFGINRFERSESTDNKRGQVIHAHDEHGVSIATLDNFRALHQRDEAGNAGVGNVLHRTARPTFSGEIGGE